MKQLCCVRSKLAAITDDRPVESSFLIYLDLCFLLVDHLVNHLDHLVWSTSAGRRATFDMEMQRSSCAEDRSDRSIPKFLAAIN